jgi:creatinine amidohydrolase
LPTQWLGFSTHHIDFSGMIAASASTYIGMAKEIPDSIAQAGFQKLLLLNSHGWNAAILEVAPAEFQPRNPAVRAVLVSYWNVAAQELQRLRESPLGGMGHACELESSLMLAIDSKLVRTAKMAPDGMGPRSRFLYQDMLVGGSVSMSWNPAETSWHGGDGDPASASAEKGERFLAAIVSRLAEVVEELRSGGSGKPRPMGQVSG